jgi:hypothetical protein
MPVSPSRTARWFAVPAAMLLVFALQNRADAQEAVGSFQRTLTANGPVDLDVLSGSGRIDVRSGLT